MTTSSLRTIASALFAAAILSVLPSCGEGTAAKTGGGFSVAAAPDDPIDFGAVPEFSLLSQAGEEVTRDTLLGRPFVLAAIFTSCSGPCPEISRKMRRLQDELAETDVLVVSLSVDPEYDTPEVLTRYAEAYGARDGRWLFLTGDEAEVYELVRGGFRLAVDRASEDDAVFGMQVTHDTRLATVDRRGRIRGWYDGRQKEGVDAARDRLLHLASEEP